MRKVLAIVEGDGDVQAVPVLLRRILQRHELFNVQVLPPHKRGELPKVKANFERFLKAAALEGVPILCILDFDCAECIDVLQDEQLLRAEAEELLPHLPFDVCLIVKEFESLFLWDEAAARQVLPQIAQGTAFPTNPEGIRPAKEWLSKVQPSGSAYKPMVHQAKLAAAVDLDLLHEKSPSFQRLEKALLSLTQSP